MFKRQNWQDLVTRWVIGGSDKRAGRLFKCLVWMSRARIRNVGAEPVVRKAWWISDMLIWKPFWVIQVDLSRWQLVAGICWGRFGTCRCVNKAVRLDEACIHTSAYTWMFTAALLSENLETTQMFVSRWMNKRIATWLHSGGLLATERMNCWCTGQHGWIAKEWKKPDLKKEYILFNSIYVKFQKMQTNLQWQKAGQ